MLVEKAPISGGGGGGVASECGEEEELECGICCMPYDRCGRAPRRLGAAHGSWKPSRCRHVMCSACVCRLAREGWWEEVTCPYCRAVTPLRERGNPLVAGVRRGSGGARRRLVLPPIDAELWHRVVRLQEGKDGAEAEAAETKDEEEEEDEEGQQWRLWRAFKRLLKGEGSAAHARSRRRGRGRSNSLPIGRRRMPVNREWPSLALSLPAFLRL
ncbi:RING finger protein 227 isoform X2 [Sceloporus undulatus]|uniref:RING finger protein 227 isoform X2 n=1 Tax=Sceloporus undulatus TaxID=8520 RepID=UPI001C4BF9B8|nr:RING finger protein 227 isoform X2 [Sceloporus undulatus]